MVCLSLNLYGPLATDARAAFWDQARRTNDFCMFGEFHSRADPWLAAGRDEQGGDPQQGRQKNYGKRTTLRTIDNVLGKIRNNPGGSRISIHDSGSGFRIVRLV